MQITVARVRIAIELPHVDPTIIRTTLHPVEITVPTTEVRGPTTVVEAVEVIVVPLGGRRPLAVHAAEGGKLLQILIPKSL